MLAAKPAKYCCFARPAYYQAKRWLDRQVGMEIVDTARGTSPLGMVTGFFTTMDRALPTWKPVPLFQLDGGAAGPVSEEFCQEVVADVEAQLRAAGSLDAVFCPMHGGMRAVKTADSDGCAPACSHVLNEFSI